MTKVIQRSAWIKPVVTYDEADLDRAMLDLWARIAARGGDADGIVGIATGGLICAERLKSSLALPVFSCAMRR